MSLFLAANARLSWSLPSITEQQVSPHRLPVQYWLKNHWPDQAFFKHSPHTNSISNSAILRNNYISLLSDLCAWVHVKKKWRRKGSHSSSVSGSNRLVWLQTWHKSDVLVHCSVKNAAVLCENRRERVTQIWTSPSEEEEEEEEEEKKKEKHFGRLVTFWFGTFAMLFCATGCVFRHEKTRRWVNGRVL